MKRWRVKAEDANCDGHCFHITFEINAEGIKEASEKAQQIMEKRSKTAVVWKVEEVIIPD